MQSYGSFSRFDTNEKQTAFEAGPVVTRCANLAVTSLQKEEKKKKKTDEQSSSQCFTLDTETNFVEHAVERVGVENQGVRFTLANFQGRDSRSNTRLGRLLLKI